MPKNPEIEEKRQKLKEKAQSATEEITQAQESNKTAEEKVEEEELVVHHEIRGTKQSLRVIFDDAFNFEEVLQPFEQELEQNSDFFKDSVALFSYGKRIFSAKERVRLRDLCKAYGFLCQLEQENEEDESYKSQAILIDCTMRSGQKVEFNGNVIVLGDVQPGAEVIASGHVMIWGTLRGTVHAGATGDETAVVCAMRLIPVQLRIAGHVAVNPYSNDQTADLEPEVAYVKDHDILAEAWDAKSFLRLGVSFEE